ncbi:MAG TPA: phosphodiesterase [bacterium]|nr:phosphodiesterase [bacterium]
MKTIIISDTHGSLAAWENVKKYIDSDTSCIIHAGDLYYFGPRNAAPENYQPGKLADQFNSLKIPFICAKGNCDSEVDQMVSNFPLCEPFAFIFHNGLRLFITHGHIFNKKQLIDISNQWDVDLIITGHTHIANIEKIGNSVFINPGSCALAKNFPAIGLLYNTSVELYNLTNDSLVSKIDLST